MPNKFSIINSEIQTNFSLKKKQTSITGKYSLNNNDFLTYNLKNNINKKFLNLELDLQFNKDFDLNLINYKKSNGTIANLFLNLDKNEDKIKINKLNISEKNNLISVEDLEINKNKVLLVVVANGW